MPFAASGGVAPYTWSITSGKLQEGLSLSSAGLLSGTVTSTEAEVFQVQVMDSVGATQQSSFSLSILFDYYMSPTGSDANPGTLAQPWAITSLRPPSVQVGSNYNLIANKSVGLLDGTYIVASLGAIATPANYNNLRLNVPNGSPGTPTVVCAVNQRHATITAKTAGPFGTNNYATDGAIPILGVYLPTTLHDFVIQDLIVAGNLADLIYIRCGAPQTGNTGIIVRNCELYDVTNWTGGAVNTALLHFEGFTNGALAQNNKLHDIFDIRATNLLHGNSDCMYDYALDTVIEKSTFYNGGCACYQKIGLYSNPPQGETFRQNYIYTLASSPWHYDGGDISYEFNPTHDDVNPSLCTFGLWTAPAGIGLNQATLHANARINVPWSKVTCVMDVTFYHAVGGGTEVHACTFTNNSSVVTWTDSPLSADCTDHFIAYTRASANNYQGNMPAALFGYTESPGYQPPYRGFTVRNNVFENVSFGGFTNANPSYTSVPPSGFAGVFSPPAPIGATSGTLDANGWRFAEAHGWMQVGTETKHDATGFGVSAGGTTVSWIGPLVAVATSVTAAAGGQGRQSDTHLINNTMYLGTRANTGQTSHMISGIIPVNPSIVSTYVYNNICDSKGDSSQAAFGQVGYGGGKPQFGPNPPAAWWTIIDFNIYNFTFTGLYCGVSLNYSTTDFNTGTPILFTASLAGWVSASSSYGPTADANTQQGNPSYAGVDGLGTMVRGGGAAQYKLLAGSLGKNGTASQGSTTGLVGGPGCDKGAWGPDVNGNPISQIGSNF